MFNKISKETLELIRQISELKQPQWMITRNSNNHKLFLDLYEKVGYANNTNDIQTWRKNNQHAWEKQDALLPGSCTGGLYKGQLVSSLGTLPISKTVAYGHSFCMEKGLYSLLMMLPQITHSASMVNHFPGSLYYAGSYKNDSRLTSQLHAVKSAKNKSVKQLKVQSLDLTPANSDQESNSFSYKLYEGSHDNISLPESLAELVALVGTPHAALEQVHQVKHFVVSSAKDNSAKAYVIYHHSLSGFTAIDIFRRSWIILLDNNNADGTQICQFLRSFPNFKDQTFELVNYDPSVTPAYSGQDIATPRYWVFTPKELVAASLPLTYSSIISVIISKYREEAIAQACLELINTASLKADSSSEVNLKLADSAEILRPKL